MTDIADTTDQATQDAGQGSASDDAANAEKAVATP